jgi:ubiquinone/menaquinone biosynthesis C-methylase UbiE
MKKGVERYYQRRAETYKDLDLPDTIVSCVRRIGIRDHLDIMKLGAEDIILDVGCGIGRFLLPFSSIAKTAGVDLTLEMLDLARETSAFLIRADAEHLPLKDEVFSVVHSAGLLGVYKSAGICEEMVRTTKRGGSIFVSFPAKNSVSGFFAVLFSKIGWNPTLLDFWYTKEEILSLFPRGVKVRNFHRLGFELPFQKLYKNIKSKNMVRVFAFLERSLREKPFFSYFKARFLVEAER